MRHEAFDRNTMRAAEELDAWKGVDGEDWDPVRTSAPPWPVLALLLGYGAAITIGIVLVT